MGNVEKEKIGIEGTLLMLDDSTPHVAVVVQAVSDEKVMAATLSDESGKYRFANLKPGEYKIRCYTLNGYVYYGEGKARGGRSRGEKEIGRKGEIEGEEAGEQGDGDILRVEPGKTLTGINFHFAPFKKGTWRTYTYLDGLAGNCILGFYCEPDGVMWFGTLTGGVSRYDGKEFVNLTTKDGLANNRVDAIHRDPDGVMWFAAHAGVSRYDWKEFVNFTTEDGLADNEVNAVQRDPNGVMWFGTGGGVSRYDGKEFANLTTEDGLVHNGVWAMHRDPGGVMWFATWGGGVSRYDEKEFVNFTTKDGLAHNSVWAIHCDPDGVMWFGTAGGVSRYDGVGFVNFTTKDGLLHNHVNAIHRDPDGVMWFGTGYPTQAAGGGISRYDGKGFVNFTAEDGLADNSVSGIHSDPDGVMWVTTWGGGISRYDPKGFVNFTARDGLVDNNVNAIHRDPDGVMWFGTNGGVSRCDSRGMRDFPHFINLTTKDGLVDNEVSAVHSDPDGVMWFGIGNWTGGHGISKYDGKEFVNFTTKDGLPHNYVTGIHCDPDGVMWFATGSWAGGRGISRYDGKEFINLTTEDGLVDNTVHAIHCAPDGMVWIGTAGSWEGTGGGVSRYDGNEFVNFTTENGLVHNRIWSIHRDPDGVMWFGTAGGVSRYDGSGTGDFPNFVNFTTEDGLAHNAVWAIHSDPDGVMWFATDGGVSAYDGTAWASLDTRDGLAGDTVSSILQDPDGSLWFGTRRGITRYRRSTTPPRVHIVSVTTDQTYRLKTERSSIPAFTIGTRVTIEYNAIDFKTVPEKRQYRCWVYETGDLRHETPDRRHGTSDVRLQTSDPEVKSQVSSLRSDVPYLPPTKETSLDWTPKEPGTYVFEVQAIDRDLNYSEPASVKLEVIPDPRNHRIAQLEGELAERERAELERVYRELEDARQIQQSLLPEKPPEIEGFEMAGTSLPAREVSGDFHNYLSLGGNVGIVLADVTGKSVKAAMVAAMTNGMLNEAISARKELWNSPSMILSRLNMSLQPHLIRGMYTAMSLGIVLVEEKQLVFSNAGMPYPIVKRGREVWELEVNGMPLGLIDRAEYQDLSLDLEGGDLVVFYSDGVIEAENGAEEMYQTERVLTLIQQANPGVSAQEMVDLIVGDVTAYAGGEEASDDITIVVVRCEE